MSALTRAAIEAIDRERMIDDVLDQPGQLEDALWRVGSAGIGQIDAPAGLLVCGMGGSAVGGDLARGAIGSRASRPIHTVRDYALPPWFSTGTLAVCSSYSGDTEETLSLFSAAGVVGAPRVAVTTGGALARLAREEGVPVIAVPGGMKPRAAVAYGLVSVLECAAACGAAPSLRDEVERASAPLTELAAEWGPDAAEDSTAKALAKRLHGTVPVVYGAGASEPAALRWRTQFNENAKLPAFHAALPEADHNDVLAWERAGELAPLSAVFLEDPGAHPRTQHRVGLTAKLVEPGAAAVERVVARGVSGVQRVMSLVLLGDLVSIYLAALAGVDPNRMEAIERLKRDLGDHQTLTQP